MFRRSKNKNRGENKSNIKTENRAEIRGEIKLATSATHYCLAFKPPLETEEYSAIKETSTPEGSDQPTLYSIARPDEKHGDSEEVAMDATLFEVSGKPGVNERALIRYAQNLAKTTGRILDETIYTIDPDKSVFSQASDIETER